jgi:hypothetical protein
MLELRWHRDRLVAVAVAAKAREWRARECKWMQGNVRQGQAWECKGMQGMVLLLVVLLLLLLVLL